MTDSRPDDPTVVQPAVPGLYRPTFDQGSEAPTAHQAAVPPAPVADQLRPAPPLPPEEGTVKRRRLWPVGVGAGLLLILGGAYVTGYLTSGDVVPRTASVAGVPLGGLGRDAAIAKLQTELATKAAAPITVTVEGKQGTIAPGQAGLALDAARSVDASGVGRSWSPVQIWRVLTGGGAVPPVVTVDRPKLDAAVAGFATTVDAAPVDATVSYQGVVPNATAAKPGLQVDVPATADAVLAGYLTTTQVTGSGKVTEPAITGAEAEQALVAYARPAVSGPVTLDTGKGTVVVTPEQIAAATSFPAEGGVLVPRTDGKALYAAAQPAITALNLGQAKDATITIGPAGTPVVTPSVDGVTLGENEFVAAVLPLLTVEGARTAQPPLATQKPAFTTEAAQALGIKEVTGEFTTYFPYAAYRNNNLGRAAASINNTLVKPGDTFSLNKTLGERTAANGYVEGYVIVSGALVKELGGGVSQSATTVYNAMFFAGLKDVEHHPHMFYIDRYPAGREATVYWGSLDLRFGNDTPHGVLVQAFVKPATASTQGSITVRIWSTKVYDKVLSSELRKSNYTDPVTRTSTGPKCEPQGSNPGFDVNYERLFYKDGQLVRTEKFFWRYAPQDKITCS